MGNELAKNAKYLAQPAGFPKQKSYVEVKLADKSPKFCSLLP